MANNKVTRTLDALQFGEQTDQTTVASTFDINDFGTITTGQYTGNDNNRVLNGMRGGDQAHLPERVIGLQHASTGSISFLPSSLTFFKYFMPGYSDDGTDYTITNRGSTLPTPLTIRGNINESEAIQLIGTYLNNARFALSDEDILTLTSDYIGIIPSVETTTVSYTPPTEQPLTYFNGVFTLGGVEMDLANINFTIDPRFVQKWGIRTTTAGSRRLPSQILRGSKTVINFDGTANLTGDATNQLETIWGGTTPPDELQEYSLVLLFTQGSKTHTLTVTGKVGNVGLSYSDSEEGAKTLTFSGNGTDVTVNGKL